MDVTTLSLCGIQAEPGSKVTGSFKIGEMVDGSPIQVPVVLANGAQPGPTVLVTACLHGDEVVGAEAVRRVWAALQPQQLCGRYVGLPVINLPAYLIQARVNLLEDPVGYNDLSRLIPTAQPQGSLTERIAAVVRDEAYPLADTVIDIHSSARGSDNYPRCIIAGEFAQISSELRQKIDRLGWACGFRFVFKPRKATWKGMYFAPRTFLEETLGKSAIVLETGHVPTIVGAEIITQGILNIMGDLGMIQNEMKRGEEQIMLDSIMAIRANRGGIWKPCKDTNEPVKEGELLGTIHGPGDEVIEEIVSPAAGYTLKVGTAAMVATGTRVFVIGLPY